MSKPTLPVATLIGALAVSIVSGVSAAVLLEPAIESVGAFFEGGVLELLGPFAVTAGLLFGLLGGAFIVKGLGGTASTAVIFLLTSVIGMMAAVYVAIVGYDRNAETLAFPYLSASPVGAFIVATPLAVLGRFAKPWGVIGLAMVLSTIWALIVSVVWPGDDALEIPGLAALYVGWQAIILTIFTVAPRKV
ncbi:hypothetical protein [Jannaschia sp. CCS1]|uniref:hypothetical protein n=1 Tax=Jannaschia sp. (strain CCS1) TaxID=290400 RepID=UPI000053A82A|nr:hypothetical protein [Jannaschia sp. CCS1]ABD53969.1 hypothetical protein Jann_1052 [Jannaschia sp. CCS1]